MGGEGGGLCGCGCFVCMCNYVVVSSCVPVFLFVFLRYYFP